jgi:nicotinamidase-related amidase
MFENVKSETRPDEIELNVRFLIRAAKALNIPLILSTVGVQMGVNGPTRPAIQNELPGIEVIDRSSIDAWEDNAFRAAVKETGKKRLIFGALYTEICLAFPVIDAMRDGYEAMFVVDAVGGMSQLAHRTVTGSRRSPTRHAKSSNGRRRRSCWRPIGEVSGGLPERSSATAECVGGG